VSLWLGLEFGVGAMALAVAAIVVLLLIWSRRQAPNYWAD